ncbi:MAG: aryl-sulfate sulfotransferase [Candidatus Promineifilaceae bacterium]
MKQKLFLFIFTILPLMAFITAVSQGSEAGEQPQPVFQYLSPRPDAELVSAETAIAFRPNPAGFSARSPELINRVSIQATGRQSGLHPGQLMLADDQETIIFQPDRPFSPYEQVDVAIEASLAERPLSYQYSFSVSPPPPVISDAERWPELFTDTAEPSSAVTGDPLPQYRTVPYDFPSLNVYSAPGTEDGYIFLAHYNYSDISQGKAYLLMLDGNGEPVYYKRLHPLQSAFDFKKQSNGLLTYFDTGQRKFFAMDQNYNVVGSYEVGNGYVTDLHDMELLDDNHALLLIHDYQHIDMSAIVPGGNPNALVVGCIVQEIDGQGEVVFEWRSWDHISILDSNQDLTADFIRYIHCNAVQQDLDGNILLSSRHLDEVTKINRQTGDIIWRLGGKQNQFTFVNDTGFHYQHFARRLPNGRISVYDNRTYQDPVYSRGVEYVLDAVNMTATKVYEYRSTPDNFGGAMGSYQRLPGGNVLVGWGWLSSPILTEALEDGTKVFELSAEGSFGTYRAYHFPWEGYPIWPPQLIALDNGHTANLYFSYNGATEVTGYFVYGDKNDPPTTLLAYVPKEGYEATFAYGAPDEGLYYFRVKPVTDGSNEMPYSNVSAVFIGGRDVYLPLFAHADN